MSWSILLLPLLGGYYWLTRSVKWKWFYKRTERQRLIFDSLLFGFRYLVLSSILWYTFSWIYPNRADHLVIFSGINIPYFFPSLLSFLLAVSHTILFNFLKRNEENWYLSLAIGKTGNSLQQDFLRSYFFEEIVMITLKNGKVYVGIIHELHEPHIDSSFVRLTLFYSGYRTNKMSVSLETDYNLSYTDITDSNDLISVVVSEAEILTLTFYDQDTYDRLNHSGTINVAINPLLLLVKKLIGCNVQ